MKRFILIGLTVLSFVMAGSFAWAAGTRDEKALDGDGARISRIADSEKGAAVVTQRIEKEFNVTGAQVTALRDKKLGYGEITIVYSLASKMPGGITDANVQQIMTLRQGPPVMGWGEISNKLGFKLGPAVSQVKSVRSGSDREMKTAAKGDMGGKGAMERQSEARHGEMGSHGGTGAGGGSGKAHGMGY